MQSSRFSWDVTTVAAFQNYLIKFCFSQESFEWKDPGGRSRLWREYRNKIIPSLSKQSADRLIWFRPWIVISRHRHLSAKGENANLWYTKRNAHQNMFNSAAHFRSLKLGNIVALAELWLEHCHKDLGCCGHGFESWHSKLFLKVSWQLHKTGLSSWPHSRAKIAEVRLVMEEICNFESTEVPSKKVGWT